MMKWTTLLLAGALVFSIGCGGTVTTSAVTKDGKTLKVNEVDAVTLKQGDSVKIEVEIEKKGFDEEVEVALEGAPEGVKLVNDNSTIAKGKNTIELTLLAEAEAKVVDKHQAKIVVSGGGVKDSPSTPIEITVEKKE